MEEARVRPEVFLVVGDLGFSVVEPFAEAFPDRYLNAGVAEQNMTGVAAGLASEGFHVFTYSIANFPTLRCLEQVRNDVCYHDLPVTVVAVGAGFAYGNLGYSHHAVQDISAMRGMPNMTVLSPADPGETRESVRWLSANPGPSYLRLGKAGESDLHSVRGIERGPIRVRDGGGDIALIASGAVLRVAIDAAEQLSSLGVSASVYSAPMLKPVDAQAFLRLNAYRVLAVVEEHVQEGGLAELLGLLVRAPELIAFGARAGAQDIVGSQSYLRERVGISSESIVGRLLEIS